MAAKINREKMEMLVRAPDQVRTPALLNLINHIARAPAWDVRFWAGVTLATRPSKLGAEPGAMDDVIAAVGDALAGGYATDPNLELTHNDEAEVTDIQWDPAFGDDRYAELVLAMMKVDDIDVRRVALEALVVGAGPDDAADFVITDGAIRRFLGWVGQENRTRH